MNERKIIKKTKARQGYNYIMKCLFCNKHFPLNGYRFNFGMGSFCSIKCRNMSYIGKKRSFKICKKISRGNSGERSHQWKGDKASSSAMHIWVRRKKGKASTHKCVDCNKYAEDWSNKDHSYKRKLSDYKPRCKKCHAAYDIKNNDRKKSI